MCRTTCAGCPLCVCRAPAGRLVP
ncbi:hypothetical protein STRTUCAR8_06381, partial [Streptomyces turgidiscabies Car8]